MISLHLLLCVCLQGSQYNVHAVLDETHEDFDAASAAVWENAEQFDPKTERMFRYLQVFSAMVMSFAHGSNDVANAMGPFSAVYYIWENQAVPSKAPVSCHLPSVQAVALTDIFIDPYIFELSAGSQANQCQ